MSELDTLQKIQSAYRDASVSTIFLSAYGKATSWWQWAALWLFSILFLYSIFYTVYIAHPKKNPWMGLSFMILALLFFGLSFEFAVRSAYQKYFKQYSDLIRAYRNNRQFLRFLIFRDNLCSAPVTPETATKIRNLLISEEESIGKQILQHPLTVILVTFLTAILGGSASIQAAWTSGVMPIILLFIIIALSSNLYILPLVVTSAQREKELDRFLKWLSVTETTN